MRYKEFIERVKETLEKKLGSREADIEIKSIVKANDCVKDSISIIEPGSMSSPTVYLNDFYEWHLKVGSVDEISDTILGIFDRCSDQVPEDFREFADFSAARDHITLKVLNTAINQEYLKDAAALPYLDLSVVFYCTVITGKRRNVYCSKISRELMESWGVDATTLYGEARRNTPRLLGIYLKEVKEVILEMLDASNEEMRDTLWNALEDENRSPMYILSNKTRNSGAGAMFADKVLKELADQLGDDLYVIPSSIHEVLLIPVNARMSREEVDAMVADVNRSVLRPEDILSDHVYIYKRKEDRIIM